MSETPPDMKWSEAEQDAINAAFREPYEELSGVEWKQRAIDRLNRLREANAELANLRAANAELVESMKIHEVARRDLRKWCKELTGSDHDTHSLDYITVIYARVGRQINALSAVVEKSRIQLATDAIKLGNSVHGRKLAALSNECAAALAEYRNKP